MKNNKKKFLLQSHSLIKTTDGEDRDILYTKSSICFLLQLLSDGNIDAIKAINTILLDAATSSLSGTQSKLIAEYIHKEMMNSDFYSDFEEFSDIDTDYWRGNRNPSGQYTHYSGYGSKCKVEVISKTQLLTARGYKV